MDVFVIHSGNDRDLILKQLADLKQKVHGFNPLLLNTKNKSNKKSQTIQAQKKQTEQTAPAKKKRKVKFEFWKIDAKNKIKKSNFVIFFAGKDSYNKENIDWEIGKAIKYSKPIYVVNLTQDNQLNESLYVPDAYSGEKTKYENLKVISLADLEGQIREIEKGNYKVFNQNLETIDKSILLEQYKIFLQTSEDLVSRRQNVNNFYISINSALIAAFGIIWALNILPVYKFLTGILLAVVGIVLSVSWIKLLASYGDLNSSKMKIISYIEKQLPASLYDAEWEALSDKMKKRKYVSFTNSEKRVPALFIVVYICVSICGVAFLF